MKTTVQQQPRLAIVTTVMWATLCLLPLGRLFAVDVPAQQTLLLHTAPGTNRLEIQIQAVERSTINTNQYVDLAGMRLWVQNDEARAQLRAHLASTPSAMRIRDQLGEVIMKTGVEPDMIPVQGEEGKKSGVEGMLLLEGGEYTRPGEYWDASGGGLGDDDKPFRGDRYQVRVSSFHIDKFKVTNEDYCRFINDGNAGYWTPWNLRIGRAFEGKNAGKFVPVDASLARHPVVLVNWYQARGYAEWAGKQLPTEAEWEYAAGGKEGRKYPWGSQEPDETRADFPIQHRHTVPVDWYPAGATPDGVFQLAGNSGEWCADYFDNASYQKAPPNGVAISPKGAPEAFQPSAWYRYRVMFKGWCKANRVDYFTCTKRNSRPPLADAVAGISFRCVKDVK